MATRQRAATAARAQTTTRTLAAEGASLRTAAATIFLLAGAGLAYEVLLTRLFSVVFQYHYVFLIVSLSIAGLSLGAALATLPHKPGLGTIALVTSALFVAVAVAVALVRSADALATLLLISLLPFAGIGYLNAALFSRFAQRSAVLYAADLAGGVMGLLAALALIGTFGAFQPLLLLAALCAVIGVALSRSRLSLGWPAALAVIIAANVFTGILDFAPERYAGVAPDKTMFRVLADPDAAIIETRWDAFARLDLVATADDSARYVFTDAGAGSVMVRNNGFEADTRWLQRDLAYLPFTLAAGATDSALILGAGAGRDVVMARLAGIDNITAVEINPTLVELTRDYDAYTGGVFDLPGVETVVADARTFMERSSASYDLIYANLVYSQAAAPATSALAENYVFTREALRSYWTHLSDDGRIAFVTHHGIEGMRLLLGALDMLQREGLPLQAALNHVALISLREGDPQARTSVVVVSRQPWTAAAASRFAAEAHARGAGALYLPHYNPVGLEQLALGLRTLDQYIAANTDFNLTPVTDDRPFFYQFEMGLPPALADLMIASLTLVFVYLSWLIFFFVRPQEHWKRASLGVYFSLLGAAYLLVEIPLIQKFQLLLEQPALALLTVIGGLLAGSALGSLFSGRIALARLPRIVPLAALAVAAAVVIASAAYTPLIDAALPLSLELRVLAAVLLLAPLGFLMGIMFPSGLRVAGIADERGIAAFWGANAVASVVGSAGAMALGVSLGFTAALLAGALLYVLAAALAATGWKRMALA